MSPRSRLVVALASTAIVSYVVLGTLLGRVMGDTTYGQLAVFNEVVQYVLDLYVDKPDLDRSMAGARQGLTDALDGDSAYLEPAEWKTWQEPATGDAEVGLAVSRRYGYLVVIAPRPGSPAAKAGVRTGDVVKTIDGRHGRTVALPVAQRMLRGAAGSTVKLTLLRAGTSDPIEVSLVRQVLQTAPVETKALPSGPLYVKVAEFGAGTADDVRKQVEAARKAQQPLVLDLRGSAQGFPQDGVKVAELFVGSGPLAKLSGAHTTEQVWNADPAHAAYAQGPLVALVDNGTAGAGEVVAAALLDSGRCAVVGEHTFGRAGVQKAVPLAEGGGLVITVSKFSSPKGTAIHGKGVEPSVVVDGGSPDDDEIKAGKDPILEKALEVLKAPPAAKAA